MDNNRLIPLILLISLSCLTGVPAAAAVKGKPPGEPPAAEPSARAWHAFVGTGGTKIKSSRLYLLGGADGGEKALGDFWYYRVDLLSWTLAPTGKSKPVGRQHAGLSCGGRQCVTSNGETGPSLLQETWVYDEPLATWTKLNCKRELCPSARKMVAMAYDPSRFYHVLFGGLGPSLTNLDDTYSFAAGHWTVHDPVVRPAPRRSSAMAFAYGPADQVVLFGGQEEFVDVFCDMWSWNGTMWRQIQMSNNGPCLHSHSMSWDGNGLIVTGGYVDYSDTPNSTAWRFTFDSADIGHWSMLADATGCYASVPPGARMAYDVPTGKKVFFGGATNGPNGAVFYDDTILCD